MLFFIVGTVSAEDLNESSLEACEIELPEIADESPVQDTSEPAVENATDVKTSLESEDETVVKGHDFSVKLSDENGVAIANKTVHFTLDGAASDAVTDDDGIARLKVDLAAGKYTVKYSFSKEEGYEASSGKTSILVITTSTSKIKASNYVAYVGIKNKFTLTLTAGSTPLEGRNVTFKVNGKTYVRKTNSKGQASLNINLPKGSYRLYYSYDGEKNIKNVSGSVKLTVKKGAPTSIKKANSVIYRHKTSGAFKIKLTDAKGNPVKKAKVIFKVNGKKYTKKTDSKGIATLKIKLKKGTYTVKVSFSKTSVYKKSSKSFKIKVKPKQARNNGMWLFGRDMNSVNLKTLQKYGFKHILLNFKAVELYGKSGVEKWVKKAKSYGIKVHLWMQVFYSGGGWLNPVKNGKINYDLINQKVKEAKGYAKIKGISGVHFDYVRYPGNAYKYKNSVNAVNTFIKKATSAVHGVNKKLIVSAAVMPEPSSLKTYYGQDIPTMGKYLDAIIPMVYKGNYNAGSKWIKSVTSALAKQSPKAKIWTGLQSYRSDSKLDKLPAGELMNDADAAVSGGAYGIILFRFGLFNYINFNNV